MRYSVKSVLIILITIVLPMPSAIPQPNESIGDLHPIIGEFRVLRTDHLSPIDESVPVEKMSFHYIGATIDGEWYGDPNGSSGREVQKAVESGNQYEYTYDLYSLYGFVGTAICISDPDWQSELMYYAIPDVVIYPNELTRLTGISCDWDPMPRHPHQDDPSQEIYLDAVWAVMLEVDEDLFNRYSYDYLPEPYNGQLLNLEYRVDEAFLIDLEGNGRQETIITGSVGENFEHPDNYRNTIIMIQDSRIVPLFKGDLETAIEIREVALEPMNPCLAGFIDANGDGLMEVLIRTNCCAGSWSTFISVDGGSISRKTYANDFWVQP